MNPVYATVMSKLSVLFSCIYFEGSNGVNMFCQNICFLVGKGENDGE